VLLELSLEARSTRGVLDLPVDLSTVEAVQDLIGGDRREVKKAIEIFSLPDDSGVSPIEIIKTQSIHRLVVTKWDEWAGPKTAAERASSYRDRSKTKDLPKEPSQPVTSTSLGTVTTVTPTGHNSTGQNKTKQDTQTGARTPDETSPEAEQAASGSVAETSSAVAPEESGYDMARRVFADEWQKHYRKPYPFDPQTGEKSEHPRFRDAGTYARQLGGNQGEEFLRHWASQYLRDKRDYYTKDRHPGRLWNMDAIRAAGDPPKPKQHPPSGPRKAAEPVAPPMPRAEHAARAEAIRAKLAGIGRPAVDSTAEKKAQ
jgi:hypothetical protein